MNNSLRRINGGEQSVTTAYRGTLIASCLSYGQRSCVNIETQPITTGVQLWEDVKAIRDTQTKRGPNAWIMKPDATGRGALRLNRWSAKSVATYTATGAGQSRLPLKSGVSRQPTTTRRASGLRSRKMAKRRNVHARKSRRLLYVPPAGGREMASRAALSTSKARI